MDFLKNNKRFSFKLGGINAWDFNYKSEVTSVGNEVTTVYQFGGGIKITNIAKKYDKYDAYEWVNYIENTSDKPSEIISDLWDCDCTLPIKHEENRKWGGGVFPRYQNRHKGIRAYRLCMEQDGL